MTAHDSDEYVGRSSESVVIDGETFMATVHWAMVGGQARCVGLDLRSFVSRTAREVDLSDAEPLGRWAEITTPVVRALRAAEVIETARRDRELLAQMIARLPDTHRQALVGAPPRRPGPKSRWTPEVLRDVVAPAYRLAGRRKPAVAVQQALTDHWREPVTPDTARKGVAAARKAGYLPAYEK